MTQKEGGEARERKWSSKKGDPDPTRKMALFPPGCIKTGLLGAPPPAAFLQGMIGQWGAQINRPKGAEWGGTRP